MKRRLPAGLVLAGFLLLLGATGGSYFTGLVNRPAAVPLPDEISGLPITNYMTGAQAAAGFEMLHGKRLPLTSGAIGIYGDNQATLWVAGAPMEFMAGRMLDAMQSKIAQGGSPFTPLEQYRQGDRIIHVLEGMGQKHYYFQSDNLVIWLSVDPVLAAAAIQQILEVYP